MTVSGRSKTDQSAGKKRKAPIQDRGLL